MLLYHFTSVNSFFRIWESKTLKFAESSNVNDILERSVAVGSPIYQGLTLNTLNKFSETLRSFKQISLSRIDGPHTGPFSTMMWSLYGDRGMGVCLELDSDKLDLTPKKGILAEAIYYSDNYPIVKELPIGITKKREMEDYIKRNKCDLLFTKTIDWEAEKEYRIVSNKKEKLSIKRAITRIIICKWNMPDFDILSSLLPDSVPLMLIDYKVAKGEIIPHLIDARGFRKGVVNSSSRKWLDQKSTEFEVQWQKILSRSYPTKTI